MKNPAYTRKHWLIFIFVSLMMGSSLGFLTNGNGVFYAPIARDLGVYRGSISLHTTFKSFATAFGVLTVPVAIEKIGLKKSLAIGIGFGTIGTFLMSFANSLPIIYFLGLLRGIGTAYYSLVPMSMILNRWFDKHNGLVTGLASGASGVFGALSAPILTIAIENLGWRQAFVIKAAIILLLALPILLYPFALDPKDEGLLPYGYQEKKADKVYRSTDTAEISPTNFILISLMIVGFLNTLVMFLNSHFPGYGESIGLNPETASLMLSGAMLGNLVWKTVYGFLSDKIGAVKSALSMIALGFVAIFMMIFSSNPSLLIFGSFIFGGTFAISGVALPILTNHFFGPILGGIVYSRVNFFASFGGAIGVGITGFIYDFTGSYIPAFVMALVFLAINAILLILAQRFHEKQTETC